MTRKMMLSAAVAMLVLPTMANAQSNTVTATATVGNYSALSGSGDLNFGTLDRNADNVIDPTTSITQRTLDYNHDVTVTFGSVPSVLTATGLTDLPVTLTCAARIGAGAWDVAACNVASFDLAVGAALTTGTLGFGGTITSGAVAGAAAGTYSGTMTILVAPTGT